MKTIPSTHDNGIVPQGARTRILGSLIGWGVGLGALTGAITGAIFGSLWSGSDLTVFGFAIGLAVGGGLGLLGGVVCSTVIAVLLPTALAGRRQSLATAVEATAITVPTAFVLVLLAWQIWMGSPDAIGSIWPWLTGLGAVAFAACTWAANRTLRSVIPR